MNKILGLIFVLFYIAKLATALDSNFYASETCTAISGACVLEHECFHEVSDEERTLCPGQKNAVCCRDFPRDKMNCYQLHNACMDRCRPSLDIGKKGCLSGTCCILV